MSITLNNNEISANGSIKILEFSIDTSGISIFNSNCRVVEQKQQTYTISNCTTVQCTTVQCTTVQCTTIKCTTIDCITVQDRNCACADSYCGSDN